MNRNVLIEGLVLLAMGVLSIAEGVRLNVTERIQMYDVLGPGNYNIGIGLLLLIVGAAYLVSFRKEGQGRKATEGKGDTPKASEKKMAAIFAILALYIFLIYLAGYPLATLVFFVLINRVVGYRSWVLNGGLSIGVSAAFYLVFVYGLDMIFSRGVLFDLFLE